jgi:hypothetical protein
MRRGDVTWDVEGRGRSHIGCKAVARLSELGWGSKHRGLPEIGWDSFLRQFAGLVLYILFADTLLTWLEAIGHHGEHTSYQE